MNMTFEQALEAFKAEFPGWWWKVGECHVSCDATISPDRYGPDEDLMAHRFFDDGFSVDLHHCAALPAPHGHRLRLTTSAGGVFLPNPKSRWREK
jgi:hypothetical protein